MLYGFPVFALTPAQKLMLDANAPMVEAMRRLERGDVRFETSDQVRAFFLQLTGSESQAEDAVLAWRTKRMEAGREVS